MSIQLEIRRYSGGDRHFHDYSQILFPMQGAMRIDMEGHSDIVSSNCVAIIPRHCEHDFQPSADCSMLIMDVETTALAGGTLPDLLRDEAPAVMRIDPFLWRLFNLLGAEVEADARRAEDAARLAMTGLQLVKPGAALAPHPITDRRILDITRALDG